MTACTLPMVRFLAAGLVSLAVALSLLPLAASQGKWPSREEVQQQQAAYRAERDHLLKIGGDKRYLSGLFQKAEEIAKRADEALMAGRLLQASNGFRQARWQLPYQAPEVPDHVTRVLGNLRLRHAQEILEVAYSPDGQRLATASRDRTVRIWDLNNGHEIYRYLGHTDYVRAVVFRPDGKMIASAGGESIIKLWDPATGKDIRELAKDEKARPDRYVSCLAFTPDGKYLVSGWSDRAIRIYEVDTGQLKRSINDFRQVVHHITFSADGSRMAAAVGDGQIRLWEYPRLVKEVNAVEYWSQQDFAGAAYHISFSPDNKSFARCGADGLKIFNIPLPGAPPLGTQVQRTVPLPPTPPGKEPIRFTCTIYSKDGRTLFIGGTDGLIRLFDLENGHQAGIYKGHNDEIRALAFNHDGSQLASASSDHTIRLWQFDIVSQARAVAGHELAVWTALFSPDGQRIVSASADQTVRIWATSSGQLVQTLKGHKAPVTCALFSPDGKLVASCGGDKLILLWNLDKGEILKTLEGHVGTVTTLDFSPDGKKLVSGGADQLIKVWDVAEGKELLNIDAAKSVVAAVAFTPDGKQIASGHVDQMVRFWDAGTGKLGRSWIAHGGAVSGLSFTSKGDLLATCGTDQLVKVWKMAEPNSHPIIFSGHNGPLSTVAIRGDGQFVVSGGADQVIKLWKVSGGSTRDPAQDFRGHKDWVSSVAFSKDGFYIASAAVDRTVRIWELTSKEVPLVAEHTGAVEAVAVSPDGKMLATGGTDRSIKLWNLATGEEIRTLAGHAAGVMSLAFTPDGKTLVSSGADRNILRWDVATGVELPKQAGHQQNLMGFLNPVPLIQITPDGKKLLAWIPGNERYTTVGIYELETGDVLLNKHDRGRNVQAVGFNKDGKRVAIGAADGTVRLYDIDRDMVQNPAGDWQVTAKDNPVTALALSADAGIMIVGSEKGEVLVCEPARRGTKHTLKAHPFAVWACALSPDGKRFATVGMENTVKLWDTATGQQLRQWVTRMPVQERGSFLTTLTFTPDGRHLVTGNGNTSLYVLELP